MLIHNADYQNRRQIELMAVRSYASKARRFMESIKIPEFPSASWAGTHVLPGSSSYQPIRMAKIEPLKMSAFARFNRIDISA